MKELDGAWEPNYLGPRVEIKGKKLIRLWRGAPVLTTSFSVKKDGERLVLTLKENGMRYTDDSAPYAEIKECYFENGVLTFKDFFPISGESVEELRKTENGRYGNVTVVDKEILPALRGTWTEVTSDPDSKWKTRFKFSGSRMYFGFGDDLNNSVEIVCVRHNSYPEIKIIDKDPSKDGVGHFGQISFRGDTLSTYIPVCDAPSVEMTLKKDK